MVAYGVGSALAEPSIALGVVLVVASLYSFCYHCPPLVLSFRGKNKKRGCVTPTYPNVHGDTVSLMVTEPSLLFSTGAAWRLVTVGGGWLGVGGGWWRLVVGSWPLVVVAGNYGLVVGGWWQVLIGSWWRLVVVGGNYRLVIGGWWRLAVGGWWSLGAVLKGCH